ncbi:hypothetical protein ABMA28_011019 [Loxostege sticticalis]|uniref:FP protein C-terminal domain-containing protein n=1 Tax=Loxostege sticticalis TaxID=481309 RepID=A0ABD0S848_LOXSC
MSCDESSQDVSYGTEVDNDNLLASKAALKSTALTPDQATITYSQFGDLLDQKLLQIRDSLASELKATIRSEINGALEKYKAEINQTIEFLAEEQKDLKKEINAAQTQIKLMEKEKSVLQSGLLSLERRLASLERSSRSHNLEIHSIPEKKSEDLMAMIKNLGERIKVTIPETCTIRRISKFNKSSDRPRNILVTFPSEHHRDSVIAAFRKYNKVNVGSPLNSANLGVPGEPHRVYIVEHLSPECKELYFEVRKAAKERNFKFVWIKYGRIYVRKDESAAPIHVRDIKVLSNLH